MTKELYLEMCEQLGTVPKEEEIPVEFEDLVLEGQEAMLLYNIIPDKIDTNIGLYLGKDLTSLSEIFKILEVSDKKLMLNLILIIDGIKKEYLSKRNKIDIKNGSK